MFYVLLFVHIHTPNSFPTFLFFLHKTLLNNILKYCASEGYIQKKTITSSLLSPFSYIYTEVYNVLYKQRDVSHQSLLVYINGPKSFPLSSENIIGLVRRIVIVTIYGKKG